MATLQELLHPQVVFKSITSRIKKPGDALQRFFGFQMGAKGLERIRFSTGVYDIFDSVRTAARARGPNTGPATRAPQGIAQQPVTLARFHEKVPIFYDSLAAMRQMGRPSTDVDTGGASYLDMQLGRIKEHFQNGREFLTAGILRGTCQFVISGDDWFPAFSGGNITIDQQIPAATNKGDSTHIVGTIAGAAKWSDVTNSTIFEDCNAINALAWNQHGWPVRHVWCNSLIWGYVTNNAGLKGRAGSANIVFSQYDRVANFDDKEASRDEFVAVLKPLPWLTWHIYDGGLNLGTAETFTKFFPDSGLASAVFCPDPDPAWVTAIEGTEFVAENEMVAPTERETPYFWPQYVREPAKVELVGLDKVMIVLRIPRAVYVGYVA